MSFLDRRLTSLAVSLFDGLEANTQTRRRVLVAACAMLVTAAMWLVHLSFPYIFHNVLETESRGSLWVAFGLVLAPPFAAAFSVGSLICPQANESIKNESGPMSGYMYREKTDKKWKLLIVAGMIAGVNSLLMLITSR